MGESDVRIRLRRRESFWLVCVTSLFVVSKIFGKWVEMGSAVHAGTAGTVLQVWQVEVVELVSCEVVKVESGEVECE